MTQTTYDEPQVAAQPLKQRSSKRLDIFGMLLRAVLPVALLALGCLAYATFSVELEKAKSPPAEAQAIRTKVAELRVRDYPVVIKTNGVVHPHNEVALSAEVSGQVTNISPSFEVGAYFSAGEVLVQLDPRDYITAVAVAQAQQLGAEAALQLATENHERNTKLYTKNGVSEAMLKQTFAAREQAQAQLNSAVAAVEQAQRDLERTKIRAPFEGRVRQKTIGVGQTVGAGTPLGVVFAVDFAEVRLPIAGDQLQYLDLPELATDAPVEVKLTDAINKTSETVWDAKIVRTEGTLDENSLELFAIARVDDPFGLRSGHPPLRIGLPVVGAITGKVLEKVIAVPRIAVRQLDQIFLVDKTDLTLMPRTIVPIWSDNDDIIVRDPSIADGQWLATTRIVYAPEGAKVEIIPDIELTASTGKNTATTQTKAVAN